MHTFALLKGRLKCLRFEVLPFVANVLVFNEIVQPLTILKGRQTDQGAGFYHANGNRAPSNMNLGMLELGRLESESLWRSDRTARGMLRDVFHSHNKLQQTNRRWS